MTDPAFKTSWESRRNAARDAAIDFRLSMDDIEAARDSGLYYVEYEASNLLTYLEERVCSNIDRAIGEVRAAWKGTK